MNRLDFAPGGGPRTERVRFRASLTAVPVAIEAGSQQSHNVWRIAQPREIDETTGDYKVRLKQMSPFLEDSTRRCLCSCALVKVRTSSGSRIGCGKRR
jgi:hypothetical protein